MFSSLEELFLLGSECRCLGFGLLLSFIFMISGKVIGGEGSLG